MNFAAVAAGLGASGSSVVAAMTAGDGGWVQKRDISNLMHSSCTPHPQSELITEDIGAIPDVTIMAGYLGLLSSIPAKDDELKGQGTDLQQSSGAGDLAPYSHLQL